MTGEDQIQGAMFSYVTPEKRVPESHPLRMIWVLSDAEDMSPLSDQLYSRAGRPSIPPEKLLRALLLQVLYTIRSGRLLMEQLAYNLLFRWFVALNVDDAVWDPSTFSKTRDRLLEGDVAGAFFARVLAVANEHGLLSDEHVTVDGTLIHADSGLGGAQEFCAERAPRARSVMTIRAIRVSTSAATRAPTTRTSPPRIRTAASTRRRKDRKRSCATWAMW